MHQFCDTHLKTSSCGIIPADGSLGPNDGRE
jgi:hypothetical protein